MDLPLAVRPIVAVSRAGLDASPSLTEALLDLNNAHAVELSWLDPVRLRALVDAAFVAARVGEVDALLIALDHDAAYDNPNLGWLRARLDRFVYVDRVVVAAHARGRGLARRLYGDLFARVGAAGLPRVVCEVNAVPPNPASDAFHEALGFVAIGAAPLAGGKVVRYLSRELGPEPRP